MSVFGKNRLNWLDQRARCLGFRDIKDLGYWIDLGVDGRTLMRWKTLDIEPRPTAIDAIDMLLAHIETDPKHFIRNFARNKQESYSANIDDKPSGRLDYA